MTKRPAYEFSDRLYSTKEVEGKDVEPGLYKFLFPPRGRSRIEPLSFPEQDQCIELSDGRSEIEEDMITFFEREEVYHQMNLSHRRGALVYGPPGNGKTYSIMRALKKGVKRFEVIAFLLHRNIQFEHITPLRSLLKDRRTVFVFEEVSNNGKKDSPRVSDLLSFLDGKLSWAKNYNVATTNYPGDLPTNVVDRPGRFDKLIRMDDPTFDERRKLFDSFLPDKDVSDRQVKELEGFSVAYIKEVALRMRLYDQTFEEVLAEFDKQKTRIDEAFHEPDNKVGFLSNQNGAPSRS